MAQNVIPKNFLIETSFPKKPAKNNRSKNSHAKDIMEQNVHKNVFLKNLCQKKHD